jgi:hypothetical protein
MAATAGLIRWEDAQEREAALRERPRYKDLDLALLLANGMSLEQAAKETGMTPEFARAIAETPLFRKLVAKLNKERETAIYSDDPDEGVEAEARNNFYTMRFVRDSSPTDATRLKAAQLLHEARPSVRKQRLEENSVRIVIESETMTRLKTGLSQVMGKSQAAIEAEFAQVEKDTNSEGENEEIQEIDDDKDYSG